MKRAITVGVFDLFHYGHLKLFQNIKKVCGEDTYLIVAVQKDEWIKKYKPEAEVMYTYEERAEILRNLRVVDEVVPYERADDVIGRVDFDIFAKGEEQGGPTHEPFNNLIAYCQKTGKQIVIMPRTPNISSTYCKRIVESRCETK